MTLDFDSPVPRKIGRRKRESLMGLITNMGNRLENDFFNRVVKRDMGEPGFTSEELELIQVLVEAHHEELLSVWSTYDLATLEVCKILGSISEKLQSAEKKHV